MTSQGQASSSSSTTTVVLLFLLLACLIILLIFLYKKLNRESEGQYTIRRMVYKEGGLRDQVRSAVMFLGRHLGVQLWHDGGSEEDGEEMQDVEDEEEQEGEQDDSNSEVELEMCDERRGKQDDTSNENSSCANQEETVSLLDQPEVKGQMGEEGEEKGGDGDFGVEASGGGGLQINLSQFSGSANWSGAEGGVSDVTAL